MIRALEGRTHFVIPALLAAVVLPLALTLLVVGARSPYTHANLQPGYDPAYTRTDQAFVGPPVPMGRMQSAVPFATDPVERGHQLFVLGGCAACHGLDGHSGVVGPPIVGAKAEFLRSVTAKGMRGMPAFAPDTFSDGDLNAIADYLQANQGAAPAPEATTVAAAPAQEATPAPTEPSAPTEMATPGGLPSLSAGGKVYAANCASCHGDKGDGKGSAADGLNPPATDFTDAAAVRSASPQDWYDSIVNGVSNSMMPAWKGALSPNDTWNVLFYIRSLAAPAEKVDEGRSIYLQNCSICHGEKGDGNGPFATGANPPPANFTEPHMREDSSQELFEIVTKGKGTMPDFQSLTEEQRRNVIAYLWTFTYGP